ncbi:MAG: hypothetical protein IT290_00015, partial [Deltaproteobacteria bacterium]|nr:hypothetical protein [Deltaproteobacteria bacterium]
MVPGKIVGRAERSLVPTSKPLRGFVPNAADTNNRRSIAGQRLVRVALEVAMQWICLALNVPARIQLLSLKCFFPNPGWVSDNLEVYVEDSTVRSNSEESATLPGGGQIAKVKVFVCRASALPFVRSPLRVIAQAEFRFYVNFAEQSADPAAIEEWAGIQRLSSSTPSGIMGESIPEDGGSAFTPHPSQVEAIVRSFLDLIREKAVLDDSFELKWSRQHAMRQAAKRRGKRGRRAMMRLLHALRSERAREISTFVLQSAPIRATINLLERHGEMPVAPAVGAFEAEFPFGTIPAGASWWDLAQEEGASSSKTRTYGGKVFSRPNDPAQKAHHVATLKGWTVRVQTGKGSEKPA